MYKIFGIFALLVLCFGGWAQSIPGTTGYFNIPSADLFEDKTVYFGFNRAAKRYQDYADGEYDLNIFYATITYLEFIELSVRYTRLDGFDPPGRKQAGDRMASLRLRALNEGHYNPAIVIGFQNIYTTVQSGEASHFNSTYLVATKNFDLSCFIYRLGLSIGYGSDFFQAADYQFIGIFGGIRVVPEQFKFLELLVEYDADKWNIGTKITLVKRICVIAGYEGFRSFSGGVSYRFKLP